jgi:hypothetical protein
MGSKSLKASWIILLVPHAAIVINGLIWALFPNVYLSSWFKPFMGQSWADFVSTNAKLASFIYLQSRYFGIVAIVIGFVAVTITLTAYKGGEKWAWYLALAGNAVGFGSSIVIVIVVGDISGTIMNIVLLILVLVALGIGAKAILKETSV